MPTKFVEISPFTGLKADYKTGELVAPFAEPGEEETSYTLRFTAPNKYVATDSTGQRVTDKELVKAMVDDCLRMFGQDTEFKTPGGLPKIFGILSSLGLPIAYAPLFQNVLDELTCVIHLNSTGQILDPDIHPNVKKTVIAAMRFFIEVANSEEYNAE